MLLYEKEHKGIVYIALYILMIESHQATNKTVEQLKMNGLVVKVMESLWDYLSCYIEFSEGNRKYEEKSLVSKI